MILRRLAPLLIALATIAQPGTARAQTLHFDTGIDVLLDDQTPITAFHWMRLSRPLDGGFSFGASVYSAAAGDGGGLFIGGFDLGKRWQVSARGAVELSGFVGGGGGASVVVGDGLMTRVALSYDQALGQGWGLTAGAGWTQVTGSDISTPILTFGLSRSADFALEPGHLASGPAAFPDQIRIAQIKPLARVYVPISSSRREGAGEVGTMSLMGAELVFAGQGHGETFLCASGAMGGDGAGYAEWILGRRWQSAGPGLSVFADLGAGFAGGGTVDTGGGFVTAASLGASLPMGERLVAELGASAIAAPDGDFRALGGFARLGLRFDRDVAPVRPDHWQLTTGLSMQLDHAGLRPEGSALSGDPLLAEVSLDYFLGERLYFIGDAQTVVSGNAGGYALGLVGLGYEWDLTERISLSGEALLGAAAGGGIDTGGGLVGAGRVELDYALREGMKLSLGAGRMVSGGGAAPWTLQLGLKMPFTTLR